jgi:CDP-diacylglycerol pyrophosphatase
MRRRAGKTTGCALLIVMIVIALTGMPLRHLAAADPSALWHILHDQCVPDEEQNHSPKPCELVDLSAGYVVLKDIVGATQFLLMPIARITGIESPQLLAPDAPNYWAPAWQARRFVEQRADRALPRDVISLAVNSAKARSQNQLHIHIDCTRLDVVAALGEHAEAIGDRWAKFPVQLAGHDYMAMRVEQPDLAGSDPFVLLADGIPEARADMGSYTLVVVGAPQGFVVLAGHADGTADRGSGEQLQDHACAAAH